MDRRELLPHDFTLALVRARGTGYRMISSLAPAPQLGRFVSVALSVGSPRPCLRKALCPVKSGLSSPISRSRHPTNSRIKYIDPFLAVLGDMMD